MTGKECGRSMSHSYFCEIPGCSIFLAKMHKKDKTVINCVYSGFRTFSWCGMIVKNFEKIFKRMVIIQELFLKFSYD